MNLDIIGLSKSILWEETKGKLRALIAASGAAPSTIKRSPHWEDVKSHIEKFIREFESQGYHE